MEWLQGNIICKIAKCVTDTCSNVPPPLFFYTRYPCGPALKGTQLGGSAGAAYYYFDGYTGRGFPGYDPCERLRDEGLKNVENPYIGTYLFAEFCDVI